MNLICTALFAVALLFQYQQTPPPTGIPATFSGTFKTAEKGRIVVEVEDGETMRMYVTHSTKYFRDGKPAKLNEFQNGDRVNVDAERDVRMNLIAVRVEAVGQPPKNPK
jgi:hypothetical protein